MEMKSIFILISLRKIFIDNKKKYKSNGADKDH